MIAILGRRRMLVLAALAGICVMLSAFYLGVLFPQVSASDRTLRGLRGDVSGMEDRARMLRGDYEQFEANKFDYDRIEQIGFFNPQNRLLIRERFQALKADAGVTNARYEIRPAEIVPSPAVEDAGHRLMRSRMEITVEAMDDMPVYAFLYALTNEFPGRVTFSDINILRTGKTLDSTVIAQVRAGNATPLITATVEAEWYSLVAAKDIPELIDAQNAQGGTP